MSDPVIVYPAKQPSNKTVPAPQQGSIIERIKSWQHSGFSVYAGERIYWSRGKREGIGKPDPEKI